MRSASARSDPCIIGVKIPFDALIIIVDAERRENVDCETIGEKADSDCSCGAGNQFSVIFDHLSGPR